MFNWCFLSFLIKLCFQNKIKPSRCLKKINSCVTVNALMEFLNYRFHMIHEKETVAQKFSKEDQLLWKLTRKRGCLSTILVKLQFPVAKPTTLPWKKCVLFLSLSFVPQCNCIYFFQARVYKILALPSGIYTLG